MVQTIQKQQVISMLKSSFAQSDRIRSMLRSSNEKHLQIFFDYIYVLVEQVGSIFVSDNQSTVLLYFQKSQQLHNWKTIKAVLRVLLLSLSWKKLKQTITINKAVKRVRRAAVERADEKDYLYVWFLAGREMKSNYAGLYEAMEHLKIESLFSNLPIYIETTVPRMLAIYKRAGFKFYAEENYGDQIIWFGKYSSHAV